MKLNPADSATEKEKRLKEILAACETVAIAYSGGVDSTYLADVAVEVLGKNAWLFIADTPSLPRSELTFAVALARAKGWQVEKMQTQEFSHEAFLKNDPLRCYYCKRELFTVMAAQARDRHLAVMIHGETIDDGQDTTRVGVRAARETGVRAPLAEAGFTKDEIRERSRARALPTWDKASFACLASRVPSGTPLALDTLAKIEQAEALLRELGCRQYRARHHGDLCRIEVDPEDMPLLLAEPNRTHLTAAFKKLGYRYITLDLSGYRTGNVSG